MNTDRTQVWDTTNNAWSREFSNFVESALVVEAFGHVMVAKTGEHAFQALKTDDRDEQRRVLEMETPNKAKRAGRKVTLREGWGALLLASRAHDREHGFDRLRFARALRQSRGTIIEVTAWNDTRWGTTRSGKGANMLGQILMQVREEIRWANSQPR